MTVQYIYTTLKIPPSCRNPSNISAGSGYYSLINTASHSRQSSYNNTVEILHDATTTTTATQQQQQQPSILLQLQLHQHPQQHKSHRRQRSDGGVSTTSDPSADEGVGDRSSTTSFNSLKRADGRGGGGGGGVGGHSSTGESYGSATPIPLKRDRSRFKKLTPDPPSISTSGSCTGNGGAGNVGGVELRHQQKSGSHSVLGSAGFDSSDSSSNTANPDYHHNHHLYLGLTSLSTQGHGLMTSSSSHTLSPLSTSLHGSQRLAETRVSSDAVIDDLFFDAAGEGI